MGENYTINLKQATPLGQIQLVSTTTKPSNHQEERRESGGVLFHLEQNSVFSALVEHTCSQPSVGCLKGQPMLAEVTGKRFNRDRSL